MKKALALAASIALTGAPLVVAPAAYAQPAEQVLTTEQANQFARDLGHSDAEAAVAAGDLARVEGGYALTSQGLAAAQSAGLLVSPALIPLAVGLGVVIAGIGLIAILEDSRPSTATVTVTTTTVTATQ